MPPWRQTLSLAAFALVIAGCGSGSGAGARETAAASGDVAGAAETMAATTGEIGDGTIASGADQDVTPGGRMDPADADPSPAEGVGAAADCLDLEATQRLVGAERYRDGIACLVNATRTDRGLRALREDARLARSGTRHSREMVDEGYFAHEGLDGSTLVSRDSGAGYPLKSSDSWSVGETLAWSTGVLETPRAVVNAWMRSTGHRRILLRANWRDLGIGTALGIPTDATVGITVTAEFGVHSVQ